MPDEDLFRIVYCSQAVGFGDGAMLPTVLETSRRNNAACNVTGALLHSFGFFLQVLEGPFLAVQAVFERIQLDSRHDRVVVLEARSVDERLFSAWAMNSVVPHDPALARDAIGSAMLQPSSGASETLMNLLGHALAYA